MPGALPVAVACERSAPVDAPQAGFDPSMISKPRLTVNEAVFHVRPEPAYQKTK